MSQHKQSNSINQQSFNNLSTIFQQSNMSALTSSTSEFQSLSLEDDCTNLNITITSKVDSSVSFTLPYKYAELCKVIKTAFECDQNETTFTVDIKPNTLATLIDYLNLCAGEVPQVITKPVLHNDMKKNAGEVQGKFIEDYIASHKRIDLYDLLSAANYIQCEPLLQLVAASIAALIKGEPLDKISSILDDGSIPKKNSQ